jgi:hypothetical protein
MIDVLDFMSLKGSNEYCPKGLESDSKFLKLEPAQLRCMNTILVSVENALIENTESLKPTPIGSHGLRVVDNVPLTALESTDGALMECLRPLLTLSLIDREEIPSIEKSTSQVTMKKLALPRKRQRIETNDDESPNFVRDKSKDLQIRAHQSEQWLERYKELVEFQQEFGHCVVPYNYKRNRSLALWVKRQRHQHTIKKEGLRSTMTDGRERALEQAGFVWDSHKVVWEERLNELIAYRNKERGHCNVPAKFDENPQLAIWVKCQRRQYKLFCDGQRSNMTVDRIEKLSKAGFVWNPRKP